MSIVLIARQTLTRHCLSRSLQAALPELRVAAVANPAGLLDPSRSLRNMDLIVFTIGDTSVRDAEVLGQIAWLRQHMPGVPLVLLIDRHDMLQAVPCNRLHTVEQRCARWLLTCADRMDDERFELTKEHVAEMLGVPQSTVNTIAGTLQQAGLIRYRRDAITVCDRRRLETAACECYRIVRDRCERLLVRAFD